MAHYSYYWFYLISNNIIIPMCNPTEVAAIQIRCWGAMKRDMGVMIHSNIRVPTDTAVKRMLCLQNNVFKTSTAGPQP